MPRKAQKLDIQRLFKEEAVLIFIHERESYMDMYWRSRQPIQSTVGLEIAWNEFEGNEKIAQCVTLLFSFARGHLYERVMSFC